LPGECGRSEENGRRLAAAAHMVRCRKLGGGGNTSSGLRWWRLRRNRKPRIRLRLWKELERPGENYPEHDGAEDPQENVHAASPFFVVNRHAGSPSWPLSYEVVQERHSTPIYHAPHLCPWQQTLRTPRSSTNVYLWAALAPPRCFAGRQKLGQTSVS
jgi:hypothetical protein